MYIHIPAGFALEGVQQFFSAKHEENVNLYWNLAEGTTAKALGHQGNCCGCCGTFRDLVL